MGGRGSLRVGLRDMVRQLSSRACSHVRCHGSCLSVGCLVPYVIYGEPTPSFHRACLERMHALLNPPAPAPGTMRLPAAAANRQSRRSESPPAAALSSAAGSWQMTGYPSRGYSLDSAPPQGAGEVPWWSRPPRSEQPSDPGPRQPLPEAAPRGYSVDREMTLTDIPPPPPVPRDVGRDSEVQTALEKERALWSAAVQDAQKVQMQAFREVTEDLELKMAKAMEAMAEAATGSEARVAEFERRLHVCLSNIDMRAEKDGNERRALLSGMQRELEGQRSQLLGLAQAQATGGGFSAEAPQRAARVRIIISIMN